MIITICNGIVFWVCLLVVLNYICCNFPSTMYNTKLGEAALVYLLNCQVFIFFQDCVAQRFTKFLYPNLTEVSHWNMFMKCHTTVKNEHILWPLWCIWNGWKSSLFHDFSVWSSCYIPRLQVQMQPLLFYPD